MLQNLSVSEKTFFGFKDGNEKTGQDSVDRSFFSRFFINSNNSENFIYSSFILKEFLDIIVLFNQPIFLLSNLIGVYALKSKVLIFFKRSIANSRVFFCSYRIFNY